MEAFKGRIIYDYFEQPRRQYVVPVYQRNYDWGIAQAQNLFEDIVEAQKNNKNHYVGSVVTATGNKVGGVENYYIIDGQQRLTTTYILLKALYDLADTEVEKETIKEWLFNKDRFQELSTDLASKLKLKSDNEQIQLLMQNRFEEMDKTSNVYANYQKFLELVQQEKANGMTVKEISAGIDKLVCARVELDQNDNPQEVFESINSKGCPLTISDLIRNYILMIDEDQVRLYNTYWLKIEKYVKKEYMTPFILDFLNFKLDGWTLERSAYNSFKRLFVKDGYTHESMLQELSHYAKFYNYFMETNDELPLGIRKYLNNLRQLRQTTIYVFLFPVFEDYEKGLISETELEKLLKFFLNYLVRRIVCEVGSNSLRGLFKTLYARIFNKQENYQYYLDAVLSFFQQLNTKDKIPTDALFIECLEEKDLYHKNLVCKYILSSIENQGTKELIDISNLTIEHIMPQNEDLSKEWRTMLGENWIDVHSKYLNTLGNLTLTGYNSELSDKPFTEKKKMVAENSKIKNLNKDVMDKNEWNKDTITARAGRLSKEVVSLFDIEKPVQEISFRDTSYKEYGIENPEDAKFKYPNYYVLQGEKVEINSFQKMLSSVMQSLYEQDNAIMERIAKNKEKVISWSQKPYVSYDKEQFRYCEEIEGTSIYYDTNLSAPKIIWFIKGMLNEYGIDSSEFIYSAKSNKKN